MRVKYGLAALVAAAIAGSQVAAASTLQDFFNQSTFTGTARAFYFTRDYSSATVPNADAFSLAGMFNVQTAEFLNGFSVGASFFTAHSLGANNLDDGLKHVDTTLMGAHYSINALGQAYLQYKRSWLTVKAGDQLLNTPWVSGSDSRVLPATYQGIFADLTPVKNLHLYAMRMFRWKSRTSDDYFRDNLYYAPTYSGDASYGGTAPLLGPAARATQGLSGVGSAYEIDGLKANLWYYNYLQFASMVYGDANYQLKTGTGFDPFIGGQYVREWKSDSLLNGTTLEKGKGSGVNTLAYGAQGGIDSPYGQLLFAYNQITRHNGAIGNGAIVSPYTNGYATDPLYTTSMIRGLVEQGPGHAWKVKYTKKLFGNSVLLMAAFARYYTQQFGNSNDAYVDLTYFPGGMFKGLSLRNRFEESVASTASLGLNPGGSKTFIYNRVMVQYDF